MPGTPAVKKRADANYRQARETLERILQRTKERDAEGLPRLKELQRLQSEEALAFYLKLADQTDDDPEFRQDSAWALRDAALLQHALGRNAEAIKSLESARARFLQLGSDFPEEPNYRLGLANCLLALGGIDTTRDQFEPRTQEALTLFESLVHDLPENSNYRTALAGACNQMAIVRDRQNRRDEAAELYRRSIVLREQVLNGHPDDRQLRSDIAATCVNFSQLCFQKGDIQNGKDLHDRAQAEFGRLIQDDPDDLSARIALVRAAHQLGVCAVEGKGAAAAIAELTKNVLDLEEMLRQEPNVASVRDRLYRTYGLRAEIFASQSRYREALADQQKAVEYAAAQDRYERRLFLALAYAQAGRHEEAILEARALAALMTKRTPLCIGPI